MSEELARTPKGIVTDRKYLKQRSRDVLPEEIDEVKDALRRAMADQDDCAGITAIQIGIPVRMAILENDRFLINPRIASRSGRQSVNEGCMSFPKKRLPIIRAERVEVETGGKLHTFEKFQAAVVQHEMDHMNGILITDRFRDQRKLRLEVAKEKREKARRRL